MEQALDVLNVNLKRKLNEENENIKNEKQYNNKNGISTAKQRKIFIKSEIIFEKLWKDWNIEREVHHLNGTLNTNGVLNGISNNKTILSESPYNYIKFDKSFPKYFIEYYKDMQGFNLSMLPEPIPWFYVFLHLKSNIFNIPNVEYNTLYEFIKKVLKDDNSLKYYIKNILNNNNNENNIKISNKLVYNDLYTSEIEHLSIALFFLHRSIHQNIISNKLQTYKYSTLIDNEIIQQLGILLNEPNKPLDFTLQFTWHNDVITNFNTSYLKINNKTLSMYKRFMLNIEHIERQLEKPYKHIAYTNIPFDKHYILAYCSDDIGFNIQCDEILVDQNKIIEKLKIKYDPYAYSIFALQSPFLLYMYLYLTIKYKFFQLELEHFHEAFNLILNHDIIVMKYSNDFIKIKSILFLMCAIFNKLKTVNKIYYINEITYPWNNAIIPAIGRLMTENKKSFTNCDRYIDLTQNYNTCVEDDDLNTETCNPALNFKQMSLLEYCPKLELIALKFFNGDVQDLVTHHYDLTDEFIDDWVKRTHNHAVFVSGTACVGKTTFLNDAIKNIQEKYNECATIMKSGRCGGFDGKDEDLILALSLQATMLNYATTYTTCIGDRTPYDNLIWRFIMNLPRFNDTGSMVAEFTKSFSKFSPVLLQLIAKEPYIIIINTNVLKIREQMKMRNHANDVSRSDVYRYVELQNMAYGVFGHLSNCIVIDLAETNNRIPPELHKLIDRKCKANFELTGKITMKDADNIHRVDVGPFKTLIPDCKEDYECAKVLKIFK